MVVICHNCHLREIPAFSISFASWEPTSRQPLLRCPLQASLQCIKNWKSDYLAKDGQRYLLYRVRIGFEVLLQFEGLVKGNRVQGLGQFNFFHSLRLSPEIQEEQVVLYTVALTLIQYQQQILYAKLIIARWEIKNKNILMYIIMLLL